MPQASKPTKRIARWTGWLLAAGLLAAGQAAAQRVEGDTAQAQGMYEAEVRVNGQREAERKAGFGRALAQVLGKLSGDRTAASRPGVAQELRRAEDYVEGYDYRQDEGVSASGAPTFDTTLVVRFDKEAVNAVAAALGLPVWPEPRPKPVLWLAIDDGKGARLVNLNQNNVVRPILSRAQQRGYRLGLPRGSAAEQAAVGAIWRGDSAAVARLSARYSPPMQLIGKLYRHQGGWKADWTFVDDGQVLSQWSSEDPNARVAMAAGADGAADALVKRYARASEAGPSGSYRIVFVGVDSSDDFIRLSGHLQGLSVVRRITPVRATADGVEFELELLTGLPGFRRLADDRVLVEVEAPLETGAPVFRLVR
ncbi:DUF2066 domain-containing protein [Luteimonas sp. R10]|uniref:DUF2066 domain-containing protein n=1 Tax=Luteimonas sp. R10 TaxID=3108176 RepID=UPI003086AAE2|nr:DUF2066 domain-containing protein [Luteimonas sp. R10]